MHHTFLLGRVRFTAQPLSALVRTVQEVLYGTFLWLIFLFSFSYSEYSFVTQIVIWGIKIVMHQSIPDAPSPTLPGYCGAFARLVSLGGGAFANFALPGDRAIANPGANPKLLTRTRFPIRIQLHKRILREKLGD